MSKNVCGLSHCLNNALKLFVIIIKLYTIYKNNLRKTRKKGTVSSPKCENYY